MDSVIQTGQLTRKFGDFVAVDQLNLSVPRGCFFGFLGPNGAGKSTTIKMLTGLLAPTSGTVRIFGKNMLDTGENLEIKRKIGVVPENLALFDNLTAREYLMFIGRMFLMPIPTIRERSEELLQILGLCEEEKKLALEYSHGMRKKLSLAGSLIPGPELLFLDEPFEGVDAVTSRVIRDVLRRFVQKGGTIFLTSHVLEIVEKLCTDVAIIAHGKLVAQESISNLQGATLESRFLELVGHSQDEAQKLSWLE